MSSEPEVRWGHRPRDERHRDARRGAAACRLVVAVAPATLHLEKLWIKDLTITTGLVDTSSTRRLLRLVAAHQLELAALVTQTFPLDQIMAAHDAFSTAATTGALKVLFTKK